ncbi:unannotated protein [freshwater metagenome]|uniref:Unannotated protein n=1 Tax=freshwater metagenome TaxID=449393 RepID=A0A6J6J9G8_9ZZZZ
MPAFANGQQFATNIEHSTGNSSGLFARQPHSDRSDPLGRHRFLHFFGCIANAEIGGESRERGRCNRVHRDAITTKFVGRNDRERSNATLGSAIVGLTDVAVDA